jgi:hypothetical protein
MPLDSYSGNVDNEIKLLRNIRIFNLLSQVFLSKTGIADSNEHKIHAQTLIQENGKLNMKLLPEKTKKRHIWKFW